MSADFVIAAIRHASKRVTVAKRAVAEVLATHPDHLTAEDIYTLVHDRVPAVSSSTVYRILDEFESLHVVEHTHLDQSAAVYHLAGSHHAHLRCEECSLSIQIPASILDDVRRSILANSAFELDVHHVALSGRCAACRR